jgi:methionine-rich copper-binding protein CopC
MKKYLVWMLIMSLAGTGLAQAHAHLKGSIPANSSSVTTLPKNILLEFNEAVQITALSLQKGDAKPQELAPLPATAASQISVPMPQNLTAGNYLIKWRCVGDDGHVMSGKVAFTTAIK